MGEVAEARGAEVDGGDHNPSSLHTLEEPVPVHHHALDATGTDRDVTLLRLDGEAETRTVDFLQFGGGLDGCSETRRRQMAELHDGADGGLPRSEERLHHCHRRRLAEGDEPRSAQHRNVARAEDGSEVAFLDDEGGVGRGPYVVLHGWDGTSPRFPGNRPEWV